MRSKWRWARRASAWAAFVGVAGAGGAAAQDDATPPLGATLRGWEERQWLQLTDRDGSYFGRFAAEGVLQRFGPLQDNEYDLDLISYAFGLAEEREWMTRPSGVRFWTGSINHRRMVLGTDVALPVELGTRVGASVRFTQEETLRARRGLVWGELWTAVGEGRVFVRSGIGSEKPDVDAEAGLRWPVRGGDVEVAVGALDVFNDFIFGGLGVGPLLSDTAFDYRAHPYTGRLRLDIPIVSGFRLEGYGLAMSPAELQARSETAAGADFVRHERYGHAGALLEWAPAASSAIGVFGTWMRTRIDEEPPVPTGAPDGFSVLERSVRVGAYAVHRFSPRLTTEGWLAREWRWEDRTHPVGSVLPDTLYQDRAVAARATMTLRWPSGFRLDVGVDLQARDVVGAAVMPGLDDRERNNYRTRFGIGWEFGRGTFIVLGSSVDLDTHAGNGFDGAYGRFVAYW